jgi:hypothetical protein
MLRISRIRLGEYNKSCSIFHNESKKIEFAFFWIFYNFLRILQVSAIRGYYWRCNFALRPLERFQSSQLYPSAAGWARRRRWPAGLDQQVARDSLGAHLGLIGGVGRRGRGSGEGARRWWPWRLLSRRVGAQCRATGDWVSHYGFLGGDLDKWTARGEGGGEFQRAADNGERGGAGGMAAARRGTHRSRQRP